MPRCHQVLTCDAGITRNEGPLNGSTSSSSAIRIAKIIWKPPIFEPHSHVRSPPFPPVDVVTLDPPPKHLS
jgi:hypothetical protein